MSKFYYQIYGLSVESEYEMAEAEEISPVTAPEVVIRKTFFSAEVQKGMDEDICSYIYRMDWSCIRYSHQGIFSCQEGKVIEYQLMDGYKQDLVVQIILSWCFGALLIQKMEIAMHGSAVLYNGHLIIISGESGTGKSTLTAELINHGAKYLSDDIVRLTKNENNKFVAHSAYPQRKLCEDTAILCGMDLNRLIRMDDLNKRKYAVRDRENYHSLSELVTDFVVLEAVEGIDHAVIETVTGGDKIKLILQNLFKQDAYELCGLKHTVFEQCIELACQTNVYIMKRPARQMTAGEQVTELFSRL